VSHAQLERIEDTAARLGKSTKTIRRYVAAGKITGYRVGRTIRLDPAEVDARLIHQIPTVDGAA
jgi:excisionase family DNA binding protein